MTAGDLRVVMLPRGLLAGGRRRDATLRQLTGREEELLAARGEASVAETVTALLHRCVTRLGEAAPSADDIRALSVGDREALLLHLRGATRGDRIDSVALCASEDCGERIDLELSVSELLVEPDLDPRYWHEQDFDGGAGPVRLRFRLPTGADQEAVAPIAAADPEAAAAQLLARCADRVDGPDGPLDAVPGELAPAVAARMAELDPQAEIRLGFACPTCETPIDVLFDTATFFFAELAATASRLYEEVHALAWYYHWSEAEILGLPQPKRRQYLDLIARSLDAQPARVVA